MGIPVLFLLLYLEIPLVELKLSELDCFFSFSFCFKYFFLPLAWFGTPEARDCYLYLMVPIWMSLSCSWVKYSMKSASAGILQFLVVSLLEWNVETNTEYWGPSLESEISWFWTHCIKIVYDVNSIIKSWWGAQGKGPTMDLEFYVSIVKINAYRYHASQTQYKSRHHVNMQFKKNTHN